MLLMICENPNNPILKKSVSSIYSIVDSGTFSLSISFPYGTIDLYNWTENRMRFFDVCPLVLRKRVVPYEYNGSSYIIACDICGSVLHRQSQKEIASLPPKVWMLFFIVSNYWGQSEIQFRSLLSRLYIRAAWFSSGSFKFALFWLSWLLSA